MIFAKISGQSVHIRYDEVVSDSVEYLKVKFEYSDDWQGYTKTAVFTNEALDKSVAVVLEEGSSLYIGENTCLVPYEVIKAPEFRVSVFGIKGESLITASAGYVEVVASGYCEGDEPASPSQSEYQQIINIMSDTRVVAQSVREDADNGAFRGEKGEKGDTGNSGVYVGSGDMPEDCNVQIDVTGDTIDMDSLATKQYVDEEIATFDFIKVVDALPESGLPNRIYLVPNADAAENNLFDEYIWASGAWEFITTKMVEVELVNYIKKQELADYVVECGTSGIWSYEKWASGKAVCWGQKDYGEVAINNAWGSLYESEKITQELPSDLFIETPNVQMTIGSCSGGVILERITNLDSPISSTSAGGFHFVRPLETTLGYANISFYVIGKWK